MRIQLRRKGEIFFGSGKDLERLRREFDSEHCVRLPNFLEPELLKPIQDQIIRSAFFTKKEDDGTSLESRMVRTPVLGLLQFLTNDPCLFRLIEKITGCQQTEYFDGRVYRFMPSQGHRHFWHDDNVRSRMIALSLNLSPGVYSGGLLQIRDSKSKRVHCEVANTGIGDAVIFRISGRLEHRVTAIHGDVPKIAYAGWFRSKLNYQSFLREKLDRDNRIADGNGRGVAQAVERQRINSSDRIKLGQKIVYRTMGGRAFLFHLDRGSFYKLNRVGSRLVELIGQNGRLSQILGRMNREYHVEAKILRRDVLDSVSKLHRMGLVTLGNRHDET